MRYWISSVILLFLFASCDSVQNRLNQLENIEPGAILVFYNGERYIPQMVVSVNPKQSVDTQEYMFNFINECPEREQILAEEFEESFILTYEYQELERLVEEESIIKIYPK